MLRPDIPFLDERVARAKFQEAERIFSQRALFAGRGWQIEPPRFPSLVVRFLGRDSAPRAGVRLQLRNYDFLPPSVVFLDARAALHTDLTLGVLLRPFEESHVPPAIRAGRMMLAANGGYLPGVHPLTRQPFLCVRGVWEYHTHPQHAEISWDALRGEGTYGLQYVIEQAYGAFHPRTFA